MRTLQEATKQWSPEERACAERFPDLFRHLTEKGPYYGIAWGLECGKGWFDILNETFEKLDKTLVYNVNEDGCDVEGKPVLHQVKSKFGGLRIYLQSETSEISKIIEEAEERCSVTCELCGAPGVMRRGNWLMVKCDTCYNRER